MKSLLNKILSLVLKYYILKKRQISNYVNKKEKKKFKGLNLKQKTNKAQKIDKRREKKIKVKLKAINK